MDDVVNSETDTFPNKAAGVCCILTNDSADLFPDLKKNSFSHFIGNITIYLTLIFYS